MTPRVPSIDPARPSQPIRPFKAWHHMKKLLADKEDTEQVFEIIQALNGESLRRDFKRFLASPNGPQRLTERASLPPLLDDHAPLLALPEGSVGRAYVDFMRREQLSAAGLVAESEKQRRNHPQFDDDLSWYGDRLRDTHDLNHVLTGYGRDALGEGALLAYTHAQNGGRGIWFIASMARRRIGRLAPPAANIAKVFEEARKNGRAARRIHEENVEELLAEPLAEARQRLNIPKPTAYKAALAILADLYPDPQAVAA